MSVYKMAMHHPLNTHLTAREVIHTYLIIVFGCFSFFLSRPLAGPLTPCVWALTGERFILWGLGGGGRGRAGAGGEDRGVMYYRKTGLH